MRVRTLATFVIGAVFGVLALAFGLWHSGSLVLRHAPVSATDEDTSSSTIVPPEAALPAPSGSTFNDVVSELKKQPAPPTAPEPEPYDFSPRPTLPNPPAAGQPPISSKLPEAVAPGAPLPPGTPLPNGFVPIGPRPPAQPRQGEADRMILPDRSTLPHLVVPLANLDVNKLTDTFQDKRDGRTHEALDIMAPRGTPVTAVAQGNVAKLFTSKDGGLTVYQFDDSRTWCYYYAHLDRYAPGLQDGTLLRKGQVLGYVGNTGNAAKTAPHLHFAVFKLGPEKKWWAGTAIDPLPLFR